MREDVQHQCFEPCADSILRAELSQCIFNCIVQCCFTGWSSFSQKWVICPNAGVRGDGNILVGFTCWYLAAGDGSGAVPRGFVPSQGFISFFSAWRVPESNPSGRLSA